MDVIWENLPQASKSNIVNKCHAQSWPALDDWMLEHYGAVRRRNNVGFYVFVFDNSEQHMEFCLKWL